MIAWQNVIPALKVNDNTKLVRMNVVHMYTRREPRLRPRMS